MGKIIDPTYFISNNKTKEMFVGIIIITQMPQETSVYKSQTKIVLDVGGFHLIPNMTIVLAVHASHLSNWKMDGWQFKDDVIIKCDGQRGNILDFDLVVI